MRRAIRRLLATMAGISAVAAMVGATIGHATLTAVSGLVFAVSAVLFMGVTEDPR